MPESPLSNEIVVGVVQEAEDFPKARKPDMMKMWIDLGGEEVQSAAQIAHAYEPEDLVGERVLCCTDLGVVTIAGFKSEALTLGVPNEEGLPVLVQPDRDVPLGGVLY